MTHAHLGGRTLAVVFTCALVGCGELYPSPTASPTTTPSPTATATEPATAAPTPTGLPETPTPEPTAVPNTPTAAPTAVPTPTATDVPPRTPTPAPAYEATIRYTSYGIPHVLASSLRSAAFGQGYALARAQACTVEDQILKVRSERARYLGRGNNDSNVDSDLAYLHLSVMSDAAALFPTIDPDTRATISGFVAGFNRWLEVEGDTGLESWCAGQPWVRPITDVEMMAYYLSMAGLSSVSALLPGIAKAQPPGATQDQLGPLPPMPNLREIELGSNGWALGGDVSQTGRGMLAANPHFPWEGELRFFESQMTVPGLVNVYGASLLGSAAINIGFNEHVAWTHTVSAASRMTFYRLDLDRNDPTRYRYDGRLRDMTGTEYTIKVKGDDGAVSDLSRTLYATHWGPIVATDEFGWTDKLALSLRDANARNYALLPQFFGMDLATSLEEFEDVHRRNQGIPWVNTMATDSEGDALYVDGSAVPNLSQQTLTAWLAALESGDPLTLLGWNLGVPLIDGSTSDNEWVDDPAAARPGLIPYDSAPRLLRRDYAFNANDSHWLPHPQITLEGYSPLYGAERTPRSPRTRHNATLLQEIGDGVLTGDDGRLSLEELQTALLSNRSLTSDLLAAEVPLRCDGLPVNVEGTPVDITPVCDAILTWDGRFDLTSVGAAAWREFVGAFESDALYDAGDLWAVAFDPDNPVATPNGLAPAQSRATDPVLQALGTAQLRLDAAGVSASATLGDVQFTPKGELRIPIHGGNGLEGCFNIVVYSTSTLLVSSQEPHIPRGTVINGTTDLTDTGYVINYGSSFVMALEYTDDGPRARAFVTYSQDGREDSPHYADQTELFSQKAWRDVRFTEADILADPNYHEEVVRSAP